MAAGPAAVAVTAERRQRSADRSDLRRPDSKEFMASGDTLTNPTRPVNAASSASRRPYLSPAAIGFSETRRPPLLCRDDRRAASVACSGDRHAAVDPERPPAVPGPGRAGQVLKSRAAVTHVHAVDRPRRGARPTGRRDGAPEGPSVRERGDGRDHHLVRAYAGHVTVNGSDFGFFYYDPADGPSSPAP
jgi:hypothetical protein